MMQTLPSRAHWLLPCALVGALLGSVPQLASGADDPRGWLEKMNQALATRNYDGTFFHLSDGRVETMRIVHRVRSGRVTERLQSLDGSGREFVRANDELTCYLPDQHTVLVEPSPDRGPFLGSLPQFDATVERFLPHRVAAGDACDRAAGARHRRQPEGSVPFRLSPVAGRKDRNAAENAALRSARPGHRTNILRAPRYAREHSGQRSGADRAHRRHALGAPGTGGRPHPGGSRGLPSEPAAAGISSGRSGSANPRAVPPRRPATWSTRMGSPPSRCSSSRAAPTPQPRRLRTPRPRRRCRDWLEWARDLLSPPSCKDIKSPRWAKYPLKPLSSSLTR